MNAYFLRPIALSFRYKWTLLASVLNALLIGVLWGASITTVYPFVEVVFQGESAATWVARKAAMAQQDVARLDSEIAELEGKLAATHAGSDRNALTASLSLKRGQRKLARDSLDFYLRLRPRLVGLLPATPFGTLALLMVLLILTTVVKGVCLVLSTVLVSRVADRTVMDMRRIFYRAALRRDQQQFDRVGATEVMTQLSFHVNLVSTGLKRLYGHSIREPAKMLCCLVGAALISWRLLILSLLIAPVGGFCLRYLSRRMKQAALQHMGGLESIFQTLLETLNGIKIVQIFNRERRERQRFKRNARSVYDLSMKMAFYDALIRPVTEMVGIITLVVAILAGAYLVLNQQTHLLGIRVSDAPLSPSALIMFFGMLAGVSDPARKMADIYNDLVRGAVAARCLYTLFETPPQVVAQAPIQSVPRHQKSIRFVDVSFGYEPSRLVLHQLNLEIPFGQTVVFVGENGCGKTTLINLLARFYDPLEGAILLDDVNLRHLRPTKLRRQMAMVGQEPILFRGTIWENICYGNPQASREEVFHAARLGLVEEYVHRLAEGYQTQVGDQGRALSGGQRQRITLARAIVANPRILILDEATSQIDRDAEAQVHDGLRDFLRERTSLLITHRRSTVELADRVIVMERGRIVGDLTPTEYLRSIGPEMNAWRKAA